MFNLFRKPQLVRMFENAAKAINKPSIAAYCTENAPKRIEKSKFKTDV